MKNNCFSPADILLPKDAEMEKWAIVACDQFTSQPEYWESVNTEVGDALSALNLILPEVYLEGDDVSKRIEKINSSMENYLSADVLKTLNNSMIYVERTQSDGSIRHGIVGMIDLDDYEFKPGNNALCRATEGTVISRIPPRVKVRENAALELPHIMLLIDDEKRNIIEGLADKKDAMEKLYDFNLMKDGGHIEGYLLDEKLIENINAGLSALCTKEMMKEKYDVDTDYPMLFAVGDGNHSLATAKQHYENVKKNTPKEEWDKLPCRYALCELVNNHDDALKFEPIHRVVFNTEPERLIEGLLQKYEGACIGEGEGHNIRYIYKEDEGVINIPFPDKELEVATLQDYLDEFLKSSDAVIDYIHGDDVASSLGSKEGNIAFLLPAMEKSSLFKTVMVDGVLPRKTFSMGHASDKRYYIEARKIK